jgi:hypothetical protein
VTEVNSFWDGELTTLERLCITSFLRNGATYNLYVYDEPRGLPAGVVLKDASSVVPRERVFRYATGFNAGSIAGFTNLFRYTVIHELGGWWIDTDVCCLQPFDFTQDEGFIAETSQKEPFLVSTAMFKGRRGSPVLANARERFERKDVTQVAHGETGPWLLTDAVTECAAEHSVRPNDRYMPVPWWDYRRYFFDEHLSIDGCFTVHFWNAMLTANGVDKNASYAPDTVFERLKRRYLGDGSN